MTKHFPVFRGIQAVRAVFGDADLAATVDEINAAVIDFKARYGQRVDGLESSIDGLLAKVAALQVGGTGGDDPRARRRDPVGRSAFASFLRTGSVQAAMRTDSGPDGGYTVPTTIDATIQDQLVELSPLRSLATVVTIGAGMGKYSFIVNRRGASSGWVGERQARPETDTPSLGIITPPVGEVYANASISQWMLDDSQFNMDAFIQDNILDEFSVQEGLAFVSGDGVEKPKGFLTQDIVSTGDATRAFGALQYIPTGVAAALHDATHNGGDALIDLVYSLKASYRAGPGVGFMMNSTTAGIVRKWKVIGDVEMYLWQEGIVEGQPPRLLGWPVFIAEDMPDVGANAYPIAFGNWRRGYRIVDHMGTRILRDPYTNKPLVNFYLTKRVGGHVADSKAIKLLKCATT